MKKPKAVNLYLEYADLFEQLTDEQAGRLSKGILQYGKTGLYPDFSDDQTLSILFTMISGRIDRDFEKYDDVCEKRSAVAKKREEEKAQKGTNAHNCEQSKTKSKSNTKSKTNTKAPIGANIEIPDGIESDFADFERMRKSIKKPLTLKAKERALKKLQQLAPDNEEEQRKILNQSVDHCWQDLYPLGGTPPPKKSSYGFKNESYDIRKHKSLFEE